MTDEQKPDLSETLEQIAEQAKPVDLSKAVARKVRILRRRRNAAGGAAAVLTLAIVGGGSYGLSRANHATTDASGTAAGTAAPSSSVGWFAYTPLPNATPIARPDPSLQAIPVPVAPSSGIVTAAAASGYTTDSPSPSFRSTPPAPLTTPPVQSTPAQPVTTTGVPGTNPDRTPPAVNAPTTPAVPVTTPPSTPTAPLPCTVIDNFTPPAAGPLVITDAMKAKARAMGDKLCQLVGGGAKFNIEEWISIGGLSGLFNGLTYDVQAHLNGAGAGPVDGEAWMAVYQAPAGTTPTFKDGTMVTLQTKLAISLKAKIEVPGGPFDAFAGG